MRPVELFLHGFASFREPTVVDFTGADYFALVGPTGAGKSTVIDAITFALYGSVPRWADRRSVAPALAPNVNRGVVRLVFDVGDTRYVAVRELRRSARHTVTVRNARLERLHDPGDTDGDTDVLAADSGVTPAVEKLLGLPFEHFTRCVVLPQGEFAAFLHAKPADRQQILVRLLGLGVYERIAQEANREAVSLADRAAVLTQQLTAYADVTDTAIEQAAGRVTALEALADRVRAAAPRLTEARRAEVDATAEAERLQAECAQLAALSPPDHLVELDERIRSARERAAAARKRLATAQTAFDTAQQRLASASPTRAQLERVRDRRAELAQAIADRPAARERLEAAQRAEHDATQRSAAATEAARAARTRRDDAAAALTRARARVEQLVEEHARLTAVRAPEGLAALRSRHREAVAALDDAASRLARAEAADAAARERVAAAPDLGVLEQARRDHVALTRALAAEPDLRKRLDAAHRAREQASAAVEAAETRRDRLRERREQAARTNHAAALRPSLVVGAPCPVCPQHVRELPPPLPARDLAQVDAELDAAEKQLTAAHRTHTAAAAAQQRAAAELDRHLAEITRLRAALADAPETLAEVEQQLAAREVAERDARAADTELRHARRAHATATARLEDTRRSLAAAAAELRRVRDPLVGLGAPELAEDDPAAAWSALCDWAAQQAAEREAALGSARDTLERAEHDLAEAERALADAEQLAAHAQRDVTAAARHEQQARSHLEALEERIDRLHRELVGAPSAEEVEQRLAHLDELAAAVEAARAELSTARAVCDEAEAALTEADRDVAAAWDALAAARDPLVPLGAPVVRGDDLADAWATLVEWARREVRAREDRLPQVQADAAAARARHTAIEQELQSALAAHGVAATEDRTPEVAVATALAHARADLERLTERRAEAEKLRADLAEAESAQQVARMLGRLLRADQFPRWLVASALDALVDDASRTLLELSGGQFELTHDNGEFLVVDHTDADAHRPVRTLSGGETFQASLALALALAAQLSSLAAGDAARLESIFLDEGFGTLDETNLDLVAGTLENLASRGEQMVGVVTHVPALAERVPVRFLVRRDQRTSRIERETR